MSTPIGTNLQTLFDDVREIAFKRGHLQARLDLLKTIGKLNLEQRTAAWLAVEITKFLEGVETPAPVKRGRKPKAKPEVD
jgi:hypothetical protein